MKFIQTPLKDAYLVELTPFKDERGQFARTFCMNEFAAIGHSKPFVQINHSINKHKGTLRGMHFQHKPNREIKLIRCISGSVYDVIIDLRKESPTFLQHFGIELSKENGCMIYVPEGFAHGFQTLEDKSELLYHHTDFYTPSAEGGVRYDDKVFNIQWKLPPVNLSPKDMSYALLHQSFEGI
jgi:dTDP-4-dehydrorhamnose 3,5-epimerase